MGHSDKDKNVAISKLLLSTSVIAVMALPAVAQERTFRSIDTNRNGVLERGELEEAFGSSGASTVLSRSDSDGDGEVTRRELRQSRDDDESDDDEDDDRDDESDDRSNGWGDDESDEGDDDSGSDESDDDEGDDDSGSDEGDDDEGDDDSGSDESDDDEDDD